LYSHVFRKADGAKLIILWSNASERRINLRVGGSSATEYALNGSSRPYRNFSEGMLKNVRLREKRPRIFQIDP
jgi:hypothetical protein